MKRHLSLSRFTTFACLIIGTSAPLQAAPRGAGEGVETKPQPAETTVGVWNLPKEDNNLLLIAFKQPAPVKTTLGLETLIEGVCVHCQIPLKFRLNELTKRCTVCSCELSNAQCLTGKGEVKSLSVLLKTLPPGTAFRVEYADPNRPEAGLKHLTIDRRRALLSMEGVANMSSEDLVKLGKPSGVTGVERSEDGKRLQLTLKEDWNAERELRWEKALAKVGAKILFSAPQP